MHRHATAMLPSTFKAFRGATRRHNITDPRECNALAALFHHGHMAVGIAQFPFIAMQLAAFFLSFLLLLVSSFHPPPSFPLPFPSFVSFLVCIEFAHPSEKMTLKPNCADAGGGGIGPMRVDLGL